MRQIGSRQESGRIGGLGPCGRELCCSTWLSNFKSVSTSAARYQNLAINQTKLSGQCGRLKCCLNYELDSYLDALDDFPKRADVLKTADYRYELLKTDIFKGIMYYIQKLERGRGPVIAISKDRVKEVLAMNKKGKFPEDLGAELASIGQESDDMEYADLTGFIELPTRTKRKKRGGRDNRKNRGRGRSRGSSRSKQRDPEGKSSEGNDSRKSSNNKFKSNKRRNYKSSKGKPKNTNNKKD